MSAARGPRPAQRRSFGCRHPYGAALLLLLVGRSTGVAEAQVFETVGVRALGMGGGVRGGGRRRHRELLESSRSDRRVLQRGARCSAHRYSPRPPSDTARRCEQPHDVRLARQPDPRSQLLPASELAGCPGGEGPRGPRRRLADLARHPSRRHDGGPAPGPGSDDCVCSEGRERYGGDGAGRRDGTDRGPARADIQAARTLDDSIRSRRRCHGRVRCGQARAGRTESQGTPVCRVR